MTAEIHYEGNLRTRCTHIQSASSLLTDAPTDNFGRGEAFSPTDLLATSLASCALTTMAILGKHHELVIDGARATVNKIMASAPRRVARLEVVIYMPANNYTDKEKKLLESYAHSCPVAKSLHPDLEQHIQIIW
jgi:putative redox protein